MDYPMNCLMASLKENLKKIQMDYLKSLETTKGYLKKKQMDSANY
jgi:hypothetical protein